MQLRASISMQYQFDIRKKPVTESLIISKTILPGEMEPDEEAMKNVRRNIYSDKVRKFISEETYKGRN